MPKKTERRTKKRTADSLPEQSGLIAKGKNSQQSARTESALDNRSHRTSLGISCMRPVASRKNRSVICSISMRTYQPLLPRMSASCPG